MTEPNWQPLPTAPKDGRPIWLRYKQPAWENWFYSWVVWNSVTTCGKKSEGWCEPGFNNFPQPHMQTGEWLS